MDLTGPISIFTAFVAYSALHSALAAQRVKAWVYDRFGERSERYYRLIYNAIGIVTLLPILALLAIFPGDEIYTWSRPWIFLGLLIQGVGAVIIFVGLLQTGVWSFFGLSWIMGDPRPGSDNLITVGLYNRMRHPLYTGGLLMLWFTPVMTTSLLSFNLAASLYLYIGSIFEELRLISVFGDQYREYQRQVPRFIPLPLKHFNSET